MGWGGGVRSETWDGEEVLGWRHGMKRKQTWDGEEAHTLAPWALSNSGPSSTEPVLLRFL